MVVSEEIARQFFRVRETGACNMFDATCVKKIARRCEFDALVSFVENGPDRLGKLTFGDAKVRLQDGGDEVSMDTFANEVWEGGA